MWTDRPGDFLTTNLKSQNAAEAGIGQNLIRVSVGLEDVNDLKADLEKGLAAMR